MFIFIYVENNCLTHGLHLFIFRETGGGVLSLGQGTHIFILLKYMNNRRGL